MDLAGDLKVTTAYHAFLDTGRVPLTTRACTTRPTKVELSLPLVQ